MGKNKYHISLDIVGEKHRNFGKRKPMLKIIVAKLKLSNLVINIYRAN